MYRTVSRSVLQVALAVATTILAVPAALGIIGLHPHAAPTPVNAPIPVSPLPAPLSPTPTLPSEPSAEVRRAVAYVSAREGIPPTNLVVVNEFEHQSAPLGRSFQAVTLLDQQQGGRFFEVLVDLATGQVEDRAAVEAAEQQVLRARYGKLQPPLYQRLQAIQDEDRITVTIWVAAEPGKDLSKAQATAFAALAARYPQAAAAMERGGKPMDVADRKLAGQIYREYVEILDAEVTRRIQPLVQTLESQGFAVRTAPGLPAVTVSLPKRAILDMAPREDIGVIHLAEGEVHLLLDSAVPTNRAPAVWSRGIEGTGVDIAILEPDNVDFTGDCGGGGTNCFRHPGPTRAGVMGEYYHATLVTSAAAGDHTAYRGMAYDAAVMSAGMQGTERQDGIDALVWALDNGAEVINASIGWCPASSQMDIIDRAFDHYARARFRMVVAAAGNNDFGCPYDYVDSPAKGWNVLAVGAYDDRGDSGWSNDLMAEWSC